MSRIELRRQAKLAEQAQRFEDMHNFMYQLCSNTTEELTPEERNLLGVAYKQVLSSKRSSWRVLNSIEGAVSGNAREVQLTQEFKGHVEKEINQLCNEAISLLNEKLLPNSKSVEAKVFYQKMKGDHHRYLSEIQEEPERDVAMRQAEDSYDQAYASCLASGDLRPSNPITLGLALNFSVFKYEILKDTQSAIDMARSAFENGLNDLEKTTENDTNYNDSKFIIQLIRDNISLWTNGDEEEDD